MKKTRN